MSTPYLLRATGLIKTFDEGAFNVAVLKGVYLRVKRGEQIGIVGASGSGKSTLLHLLGGLDSPTAGQVEIDQQDLSKLDEAERGAFRNEKLGFIYQFHHLLPEFTALENVAMPLLLRRGSSTEALAQASAMLSRVGLEDRLQHRPSELSGGERQRVAIGRALMNQPSLVLFDEPTSALDTELGEQVMELISREMRSRGVGGIFVTHDTRMTHHADRTLEIVDGRLQA